MQTARLTLLVILLWIATITACSKNEAPPAGEEMPVSRSAPAPGDTSASAGLPVPLRAPEGWIAETPSSSMRQAQFRLPGEAGDAEVAVFTGIGGSPQANIDRWVGQFSGDADRPEPQTTSRQIGPYRVTVVDVSGTYHPAGMGPMMGGGASAEPKPGYRMLAAIIELEGQRPVFVKLTGPAETVEKWADSFQAYLDSLAGN
ncbi:MAG: hypothetical protein Kow00109_26930 [Acidobacteriota bacterium]